jgi:hypothetical protein
MFPQRQELGFYIPEDGIFHSYRDENLKSYLSKININIRFPIALPVFRVNILVYVQGNKL